MVHLTVAISELATVSKPIIPVSATEQIGEYVDVAVGKVFLNPVESISEVAEATLRLARIQAYASISESSQVKPPVKLTAENSLTQLAALRVSKILIDLVESIRDGGYVSPIYKLSVVNALTELAEAVKRLKLTFDTSEAIGVAAQLVKGEKLALDLVEAIGEEVLIGGGITIPFDVIEALEEEASVGLVEYVDYLDQNIVESVEFHQPIYSENIDLANIVETVEITQ